MRIALLRSITNGEEGHAEPTIGAVIGGIGAILLGIGAAADTGWLAIVGGYATKEVVERAKFQPHLVGPDITKDDVAFLGSDPGKEIDEAWWDEMLVQWFDVPEEEKPAEEEGGEAADSDSPSTIKA